MPEQIRGRFGEPSSGDSLEWICATLARIEARQEMADRELAALTTQLADLDAVLRHAAEGVPAKRAVKPRPSSAAAFLRLVPLVALIAVIGLGVIAAATHPGHVRHRAVRCTTSCSRTDGRQDRASDLR